MSFVRHSLSPALAVAVVLATALPAPAAAIQPPARPATRVAARPAASQPALAPVILDSTLTRNYQWRNLGPDKGGRSIASSGVKGQPKVAYFGAIGGGLWKTTDSGDNWFPVTDGQITSASVGAVAVSESNPDLVFIGMGESCIRGNIMPGDGVYRSKDAGKTWTHVGFKQRRRHLQDPHSSHESGHHLCRGIRKIQCAQQ